MTISKFSPLSFRALVLGLVSRGVACWSVICLILQHGANKMPGRARLNQHSKSESGSSISNSLHLKGAHTHTHWHTHTHIHIYIHDIYIYLYTYIWHRLFFQHLHTQLVNTWPFKLLSNPYKTIPPICLCVKVFVHLVFVTNLLVRWFWRKQPDVPSPFGHFLVGSRFALPVQAGRSTVTLPKKARCQLKF